MRAPLFASAAAARGVGAPFQATDWQPPTCAAQGALVHARGPAPAAHEQRRPHEHPSASLDGAGEATAAPAATVGSDDESSTSPSAMDQGQRGATVGGRVGARRGRGVGGGPSAMDAGAPDASAAALPLRVGSPPAGEGPPPPVSPGLSDKGASPSANTSGAWESMEVL